MGLVGELGSSINAANVKALTDMIALGQVAAGQTITSSDVAIGTVDQYTRAAGSSVWQLNGVDVTDQAMIDKLNDAAGAPGAGKPETTVTAISDIIVDVDGEIQAGGLVELQFKIDQMMAAVQEGIKNTGKVSQTREGAARA